MFNTHPLVRRTALVGVGPPGQQWPVLCVELQRDIKTSATANLCEQLQDIGLRHAHTARVQTFLFHPGFPVDIRHNAKIGREQLALWAAKKLGMRR